MKKNAIITGGTSGFGIEIVKGLITTGNYNIYLLARNKNKFQKLINEIPIIFRKSLFYFNCELGSFKSINESIKALKKNVSSIDLLINNAGIFPSKERKLSKDGFEITFAINHLATFLLTNLLLKEIPFNIQSRIINTASFQHLPATLNWEDLNYIKTKYNPMKIYQQSKLCNVMFTFELSKKLERKNIMVNCFDPGIVDTSMTYKSLPKILKAMYPLLNLFFRTPKKGAETAIYLSKDSKMNNITGNYYRDLKKKNHNKIANLIECNQKLWKISENLIRESF